MIIVSSVDSDENNVTKRGASHHEVIKELHHIQKTINHNHTLLTTEYGPHDPATPGQVLFRNNIYERISGSLPILYWRIDLPGHTLGNHLGTYFDTMACAYKSGFHFIGLSPRTDSFDAFYNAFPQLVPHTNPTTTTDRKEMLKLIDKHCSCGRYCWRRGQVWESIIPRMRQMMKDAIRMHVTHPRHGVFLEYTGLFLDKEKDIYSVDPNVYLPLFPDVAIHYRCSDNLFDGMGCLAFKTIIDRIPRSSTYIYIFSEYGHRLDGEEMANHNELILRALVVDIQKSFPDSIVIVKRGGNVFTTISIFGLAGITICSPSTFCFYPAMSRDKTTYFIAGDGHYIDSTIPIHPNFYFVKGDHLYYSNFSKTNTIEQVLETLRIGLS